MTRQVSKRLISFFTTLVVLLGMWSSALAAAEDTPEKPQDPLELLVTNLYEGILGREGVPEEIAFWSSSAKKGELTGAQLALNFLTGDEFPKRKLGDADFVRALYLGVLGREGSDSEVGYWDGVIGNGASRSFVMSCILNSEEFGKICANCGIEQGSYYSTQLCDKYPKVSAFVARLYSNCLDRRFERSGLNYWLGELVQKKQGGFEVAKGFFDSEEFKAKELINEEFVTVCYRTILDREPEIDGLIYWVGKLSSKEMTRGEVLELFCTLPEFRGLCDNFGIFYSTTYVRRMYPEACEILDKVGWDIRKAYDWSVGITYVRSSLNQDYGTRYLAHLGFSTRQGNCYVYAATFYEMTQALGYDSHQIVGYVKNRNGGLSPHSWVEIDMEGTTYVFDPEFEQTKPGRDGWKFHYGKSGTWMYADYYRFN